MSDQPTEHGRLQAIPRWVLLLIPVLFYAAGLSQHITDRWTGLHDWNGAFYSQLARNLIRYPFSLHHGIPIVAVGEAVPPPEERSLYARHPPLLVWLLAADFLVLEESEWTARLLPIAASIGSLLLLWRIVERRRGRETAFIATLFYSVMPMTVFFGRMVDQEPLCLFFMFAAINGWAVICDAPDSRRQSWAILWTAIAMSGAIWTDWAGVLFASLFCLYAAGTGLRKKAPRHAVVVILGCSTATILSLLLYLVHYGFDGRWADVVALFQARTGGDDAQHGRIVIQHVIQNITLPLLILWCAGLLAEIRTPRAAAMGLGILFVTGILWILILWRQFIIHSYWMFYLAPSIAVSSAWAVVRLQRAITATKQRGAMIAPALISIIVVIVAVRGTDQIFSRRAFPADMIEAWREIALMTRPTDRVLLHRGPTATETHGATSFRNIIPPQMAYYVDRAFDVLQPPNSPFTASQRDVLFIAPANHPIFSEPSLKALLTTPRVHRLGPLWAVDLPPKLPAIQPSS